jgi:hypothetical protein
VTRDELIEAGTKAVLDQNYSMGHDSTTYGLIENDVAAVLDTVEPLIRADESAEHVLRADSLRAQLDERAAEYEELWEQWDVLRAKVAALPDLAKQVEALVGHPIGGGEWVLRSDVLDLIDGRAE